MQLAFLSLPYSLRHQRQSDRLAGVAASREVRKFVVGPEIVGEHPPGRTDGRCKVMNQRTNPLGHVFVGKFNEITDFQLPLDGRRKGEKCRPFKKSNFRRLIAEGHVGFCLPHPVTFSTRQVTTAIVVNYPRWTINYSNLGHIIMAEAFCCALCVLLRGPQNIRTQTV